MKKQYKGASMKPEEICGSEGFYTEKCEQCGKQRVLERYWISEIEYYDLCNDCVVIIEAHIREIES